MIIAKEKEEKEMIRFGFELVDSNLGIPPAHKCSQCASLLYTVHECPTCSIYFCELHLPPKCGFCNQQFSINEERTQLIRKKYKVRCAICKEGMMLGDLDYHFKKECKKLCTQNCGEKFSTDEEMNLHIKEACINSIIRCMGFINCKYKDKRGLIVLHQYTCDSALNIMEMMEPLNQKIIQQNEKINLLNQKIANFEKYNHLLENQLQKKTKKLKKKGIELKLKGLKDSLIPIYEMGILSKFISHIPFASLTPIYKASLDGFSSKKFHEKCDEKEKILVIIKANDYFFGGYSSKSWNSRNFGIGNGVFVKCDNNFIFSLSNPDGNSSKFECVNPETSIYDHSHYSACFGYDIFIADNSNQNQDSYSNLGHSYECKQNTLFISNIF